MIKVILMGTGSAIPDHRNASSILVKINNKPIVFDSGSGYVYNLRKFGINYRDIDNLFYTHLHYDHIADLPVFIWACTCDLPEPRQKELNLFGPKGFKKYMKNLLKNVLGYGKISRKIKPPFDINIKELKDDVIEFDGIKIKTKQLKHVERVNSIGYRIESEGKVIVYSGDTGVCDELIELSKNADLLIIDCSHTYHFDGHLNAVEVGEVAKKANVKKVVLTHFYPDCEGYDLVSDVKKNFDGEIIVGEDFMEIEL